MYCNISSSYERTLDGQAGRRILDFMKGVEETVGDQQKQTVECKIQMSNLRQS